MGLQFYVGEIQAQINEATRMNSEAQQAISTLQTSISQFLSAPLSGKAYTSAKNYFSVAFTPLCRSAIMTGEALAQAHKKLLSEYQGSVSSIDTNEDEILEQISQFEQLKRSLEDQMRTAKTMRPDLEKRYMNACDCIKKRREKLQKFHDYNSKSASFFSEFDASLSEFKTGLAQVQNSKAWNSSAGTFDLALLDMSWSKEINSKWDKRIEKQVKQNNTKGNSLIDNAKDVTQDTIGPIVQDTAMGFTGEWLEQNGDKVATGLYNTGTKYFGGTEVASGFYAGSKLAGSASKAMPIIGAAIDYGSMVASGESANDAMAKTGAHVIASVGIGLAVTAVGLTGGGAIVVGAIAAWAVNEWVIDPLYDISKKAVGNAVKSIKNWVGNVFA